MITYSHNGWREDLLHLKTADNATRITVKSGKDVIELGFEQRLSFFPPHALVGGRRRSPLLHSFIPLQPLRALFQLSEFVGDSGVERFADGFRERRRLPGRRRWAVGDPPSAYISVLTDGGHRNR